jgi:hypothetical protein
MHRRIARLATALAVPVLVTVAVVSAGGSAQAATSGSAAGSVIDGSVVVKTGSHLMHTLCISCWDVA